MEGKGGFVALGGLVLMMVCCVGLPMLFALGGIGLIAAWFSDNVAVIAVAGLVAALLLLFAGRRHLSRITEHRQD